MAQCSSHRRSDEGRGMKKRRFEVTLILGDEDVGIYNNLKTAQDFQTFIEDELMKLCGEQFGVEVTLLLDEDTKPKAGK